ncbi:hypothetical protein SAMN06297387_10943 [Streptomyces zhaozhouensis]|uniref:Uncharacterized protein n=1 Tax=Streptomyces zhaozhouensis TaxID=1300267 RepID=A0A286DWR8_9ACTN|nr:hypothetical protein [Streptomyces zhaozhouensis]SOD63102.1 hypothetical protein SAMN06297387_10943 [Streptomyces zhaozhouensis]
MNPVEPVVFPAQRPLVRWGVLRRARITVENGRLVVRQRWRSRSWPLGPEGVASAVYLPGKLCTAASRTGGGGVSSGKIGASGGCLHLLDGAGKSVACLPLGGWLPTGGLPLPLERPDSWTPFTLGPGDADYAERSGLAPFLRHHGIPVHVAAEDEEEPPRAAGFAGPLRPGPELATTVWALPAFASMLLFFFSWAPPGAEWRNAMASLPFLIIALVTVVPAAVLGLAGTRAGRTVAAAELRPRPGVPVTRSFLDRSALRLTAEAVELRTAQRMMRLMPPPADPVLGLREAVVLEDQGRPWGVALVDDRETVHAFLHWDTWFAGDPQLVALGDFCRQAGLGIRKKQLRAFPGRQREDRTAGVWRAKHYARQERLFAYSAETPGVMAFGIFSLVYGLFVWDLAWDPFYPVLAGAFLIAVPAYAVRGAYRKWKLNVLVPPEGVGATGGGHGARLDKQGEERS